MLHVANKALWTWKEQKRSDIDTEALASALDVNQLVSEIADFDDQNIEYFTKTDHLELNGLKHYDLSDEIIMTIINRINFYAKKRFQTNERVRLLNLAHRVVETSKNKLYIDFYSDLINLCLKVYIEVPYAYELKISELTKGTKIEEKYKYSEVVPKEQAVIFIEKYLNDNTSLNGTMDRFNQRYIQMIQNVLKKS
jgi:hypothetical protein